MDNPISVYIIAGFVLTLVIVGGVNLIGFSVIDPETGVVHHTFTADEQDKYNQFNKSFNKIGEVNSRSEALANSLSPSEADIGLFGYFDAIVGIAYNTLANILTSFGFIGSIFPGLDMFGIPSWVTGIILSIITIVIVFTIFSAIFRVRI